MAMAQQNNWHVLLDAGSIGPNDMDSLGLSLFRPDFIITSFYRVFGSDPTGFGCLLIRKSAVPCLQNRNGGTGAGMVRIVPVYPQYYSDSMDNLIGLDNLQDEMGNGKEGTLAREAGQGSQLPVFSGAFTNDQVMDVFENEMNHDSGSDGDWKGNIHEETESISVGDVMRSPMFSEDDSADNLFWIDLGRSPLGSCDSGELEVGKSSSPLPPPWFSGRRKDRRFSSPKFQPSTSNGPISGDRILSFDAAVQSVSEHSSEGGAHNGMRHVDHQQSRKSNVEPEIQEEDAPHDQTENGTKHHQNADVISNVSENISTSEATRESIPDGKGSAIRRETEGEFRLLGRREGNNRFNGGRIFGAHDNEHVPSVGRRVSFRTEVRTVYNDQKYESNFDSDVEEASISMMNGSNVDASSDVGEDDNNQEWSRREPEIICRHLDHVTAMGLNKTTMRLRYLINWLVTSLLQLRLPHPDRENGVPLVFIYGPKIKYERGAALAFNIKNNSGSVIKPEVVQKLADKSGISLGVGFLSHVWIGEGQKEIHGAINLNDTSSCKPRSNKRHDNNNTMIRIEVVTASPGFLTNFEDVYRLWVFVARFLDPSFVEEDRLSNIYEAPDV